MSLRLAWRAARSVQKASKRPLKRRVRKLRTAVAPSSDQNMPDYLRRFPTKVLHPASTPPLPMNQPFWR